MKARRSRRRDLFTEQQKRDGVIFKHANADRKGVSSMWSVVQNECLSKGAKMVVHRSMFLSIL